MAFHRFCSREAKTEKQRTKTTFLENLQLDFFFHFEFTTVNERGPNVNLILNFLKNSQNK